MVVRNRHRCEPACHVVMWLHVGARNKVVVQSVCAKTPSCIRVYNAYKASLLCRFHGILDKVKLFVILLDRSRGIEGEPWTGRATRW
jgi:hypothetical protein